MYIKERLPPPPSHGYCFKEKLHKKLRGISTSPSPAAKLQKVELHGLHKIFKEILQKAELPLKKFSLHH
jgi:hypothetical protein